jgi:hypothetical protein
LRESSLLELTPALRVGTYANVTSTEGTTMASTRKVELGFEHPETGEDLRVICSVTPGTPDRGPDFGCAGGYPGDPAEVEVLRVLEDRPCGRERPELVELVGNSIYLRERALEHADEPPYDTREEARGER